MDILDLGDKVIDRLPLCWQVTEKPKKKKIK